MYTDTLEEDIQCQTVTYYKVRYNFLVVSHWPMHSVMEVIVTTVISDDIP